MFALCFTFPQGRYHATPWGRHVNEGAVAWPPEPWRLLRALIAVWHRKGDQARWPRPALDALIEALAAAPPNYRLPAAIHVHTRHYMPQAEIKDGRERTALVFDAFYRVAHDDPLVAIWPETTLDSESMALARHLAGLLFYLGRAESVVEAEALDVWTSEGDLAKPLPAYGAEGRPRSWGLADMIAPLTAAGYAAALPQLRSLGAGLTKKGDRERFNTCLPESLTAALEIDSGVLQAAGWSRPPASQTLTYARPEVGPRALPPTGLRAPQFLRSRHPTTTARFILAGRPPPLMTDAVKIGEIFRAALMFHYGQANGGEAAPPVLSGRSADGAVLRDPAHSHAFFLPEDADNDGKIDHLVLHASGGLDAKVLGAVERLRRLWLGGGRAASDDEDEASGREEWLLALEGVGQVGDFPGSHLLDESSIWESVTPYLRTRHLKSEDVDAETYDMVARECETRGWPIPEMRLGPRNGREVRLDGSKPLNTLRFHRFRSRHGLIQPDRTGTSLVLTFAKAQTGPIALGFGCHFGLGLFRGSEREA